MLTLKDCIDFAGLTPEQIEAIARREGLPEISATCLASALASQLEDALERGDGERACELQKRLEGFVRYN
ncbi:MAG: hypothetical protein NDJ89_17140 [Oligoflexia bacterium]|nr:hypothetical protein [Oligoflexia bacterium]